MNPHLPTTTIGLIINIPAPPELTQSPLRIFPGLVVSQLIKRAIEMKLDASGLSASQVAIGVTLPRLKGVINTNASAPETIAALRVLFEEVGLTPLVHLYRYDERELIFRPEDGGNSERLDTDAIIAETMAIQAEVQTYLRIFKAGEGN